MIYFTADLHLGHSNILKYDKRPFELVEEHDETIIENWNNRVKPEDDVYILGDISWHFIPKTVEIYNALKGKKHLITGNHDEKYIKSGQLRDAFVEITGYKEINVDNSFLVLCHYPIPCFNRHFKNAYHFYGHVHNSREWGCMEFIRHELINQLEKPCNMINVGCMMPYMNYTPKIFREIVDGYNMFEKDLPKCLR